MALTRKLFGYARIFYDWRIKKTLRPQIPEDISIELTNTCNFKCSFCPQSDPKHFDIVTRSTLAPDQAEVLLKKIRAGGVKTDVIHWTLDGEPFINREIDEICGIALEHGWRHFIFATNGYFCTPDRVQRLPRTGGATYTLAIDYCSDKALFETNRGTPSSWETVGNNISAILGSSELEHIAVKVTDISSFVLSDTKELQARLDALRGMFPESGRLTVRSRIFHNATGHVQGILEKKRALSPKYNLCPYPWTSLVVASNGDVVACCRDLQHKTVLGNLFREELADIWHGSEYQALRRSLVNQTPEAMGACAGCDLPYDEGKFSWSHILKTGVGRLGIFK